MPNIVIGAIDELIDVKKYPLAFRAINTNTQWIEGGIGYELDVLKRRKAAVIGDTSGYGTSSAKTAGELLEKAGVKPVYTVLIDANKTDLTDEMTKAKAAGADVLMPWSSATGLMARLLNTRGSMGWDVPVVGHPALMALPIKALLNKPEYWENVFAAGYTSTTYVTASCRSGRRSSSTKLSRRSEERSTSPSGGSRSATTPSRSSSML